MRARFRFGFVLIRLLVAVGLVQPFVVAGGGGRGPDDVEVTFACAPSVEPKLFQLTTLDWPSSSIGGGKGRARGSSTSRRLTTTDHNPTTPRRAPARRRRCHATHSLPSPFPAPAMALPWNSASPASHPSSSSL